MKQEIIAAMVAVSAGVAMAAPEKPQEPRQNRYQEQPRKAERPKTLDRAEPDKRHGDGFLWDGAREGAALDRGRPGNPPDNNWDLWVKK